MPAFSAFPKTAPIALFALALAGFVPVTGFAQDTAVAEIAPDAVEADAAVATVYPVVADLLSLTLAPDVQVSALTGDDSQTWASLAHPEFPDLVHTAVYVGHPGADIDTITAAVLDRFDSIDAVAEGEHQGAPVWVISGSASVNPDGTPAQATGSRAHILVTQACLPDGGPAVFGIVTSPMRAAPEIMAAILGTVTLSLPADAAPCPAEIGAAIMALPLGAIDRPAPMPEVAAVVAWTDYERFGIQFTAPEGMRVRRDRDNARGQEYWLTNTDEETTIGSDTVLRIFTTAQRVELSTDPIDSPEFVATLSRLGGIDVVLTDETVQLGATTLSFFRGAAIEEDDGVTAERRLLYLINADPTATGLNPWIAINNFGLTEAEATAYEQQTLAGLQLADAALYDGVQRESFHDGAVEVAVLAGQTISGNTTTENFSFFRIADQATPAVAHTLYAVEARDAAGRDIADAVRQRLTHLETVTQGMQNGVPVWLFDGRTDRLPTQERTPDGVTSPARLVITQQCAPGAGPFVIGILVAQERFDAVGGFGTLMEPVQLTMPTDSAACPAEAEAALAAITPYAAETQTTPQAEVQMPPPPAASNGKPDEAAPVIALDPEEEAWAAARAEDTMQAMMGFLLEYPRGQYSIAARDRLAMLTPAPAVDTEAQAWQTVREQATPEAVWTYLKAYPGGTYQTQAQDMLRQLSAPATTPAPEPSKRG